ncbi:MAG: hypothetical protein GXP52_05560 [Deltaproteobacteria bacterium]|nr:hypothetical protein [Deltaproteobacteria bacterium]
MNRSALSIGLPLLTVFALVFSPAVSQAACVKRALTAGEQAYYEQVKTVMDKALPAPKNWRRIDSWMHVPETVCEGFEKNPIKFFGQLKFTEITEVDRIREEMARKQKEREEKVMEANSRGNVAEVSRIQKEMQQDVSKDLERLRKAQEKARNEPKPLQMIAKFTVNDKRKAIGKKFDVPALPHTIRTFEVLHSKGTERETVSKILLIGGWQVEDFMKNWNLIRPDAPYDAIGGIHLKLSGKRQPVEAYLSGRADIGLIESAAR